MSVCHGGNEGSPKISDGLVLNNDQQESHHQQVDQKRWLEPRKSPQIILLQGDERPIASLTGKRQCQNQSADGEKQLYSTVRAVEPMKDL